MTLLDFVRMTRHNAWLLLASVVLGLVAAAGYSLTQPTLYGSVSTGIVVAGNSNSISDATAGMVLAEQKAAAYTILTGTRQVTQDVADGLRSKYGKDVPFSLSPGVTGGSVLFTVTAIAPTPSEAKDAADLGLTATADAAARLESLTTTGTPGQSVVKLQPYISAAESPNPVSPNWKANLPIGAIAGLVIGYGIAFIRRSIDGRVRTQSEVEELTGAGVIGVIPKVAELEQQRVEEGQVSLGEASEAFRHLRTNLRYVNVDSPPKCIVVTSANASEGKSTVAANLARVLAESGQITLLVDADLRRPSQHRTFDLDGSVGLTQVLAGDVSIDDAIQNSELPNLKILSAGRIPPNPSELVGSQRMHNLLVALSENRTVIVDAPPLLPVTDGGLLTAAADGAILVMATGRTYKEQLRVCARILKQVNGRLLGSVMNLAPLRGIGAVVYGYGYGTYTYSSKYYRYARDTAQQRGRRAGKPKADRPARAK